MIMARNQQPPGRDLLPHRFRPPFQASGRNSAQRCCSDGSLVAYRRGQQLKRIKTDAYRSLRLNLRVASARIDSLLHRCSIAWCPNMATWLPLDRDWAHAGDTCPACSWKSQLIFIYLYVKSWIFV